MRALLPLVAFAVLASAAAPGPAIRVEQAQVRVPAGGLPSTAAYMTLKNSSDRPDRLIGASCACARSVTLHQSVDQGGVSRMLDLKTVEVPAHGEAAFAASGRHLMVEGLKQPIKAGDQLAFTLTFEKAGPVRAMFAADPMAGMVMDHNH
jgi:copper(I)-binding protein